jgi:hypothetical protein
MAIFATYAAYLVISTGLTVAVGSALSRSGKVFLTSVFGGDESLAGAVDRLLVMGFYLLNLGFVTLTVRTSGQITSAREAFGVLFSKIGEEFLVLGALHLANIACFAGFRHRSRPGPGQPGQPVTPGTPATPGPGAPTFRRPAPWRAVH